MRALPTGSSMRRGSHLYKAQGSLATTEIEKLLGTLLAHLREPILMCPEARRAACSTTALSFRCLQHQDQGTAGGYAAEQRLRELLKLLAFRKLHQVAYEMPRKLLAPRSALLLRTQSFDAVLVFEAQIRKPYSIIKPARRIQSNESGRDFDVCAQRGMLPTEHRFVPLCR